MNATPPTGAPIVPAIPWYRSPVIISQVSAGVSSLIAIAPKNQFLSSLGLTDPHTVSDDVTAVFGFFAVIASIWGAIARARSSIQPLTLTKLSAELHPNTLAVNAAQQASNSTAKDPPKP